ncbi:MAG TPA: hypothetical protein GX693_03275, partial [Firmicutes bacterium]|nr:hypothetical protein [Bacillota bacterium]
GRGRLRPEDLGEALAGRRPQAAGPAATPRGLCLEKVEYQLLARKGEPIS